MTPLFQYILPLPHCQYHSWCKVIAIKDGQVISNHGCDMVNPQYSARNMVGGVVVVRLNQCTCHMPYPMTCALIPFLHVKWEAFNVRLLNFNYICMLETTTKALNHAAKIRCMNLNEWNISFDVVSTPKQNKNTHRKRIAHHVVVHIVINVCKLADVVCYILPEISVLWSFYKQHSWLYESENLFICTHHRVVARASSYHFMHESSDYGLTWLYPYHSKFLHWHWGKSRF